MEYLTGKDLDELSQLYPHAYYWLLHRQLQNEYKALKREDSRVSEWKDPRRTKWVKDRIIELEKIVNTPEAITNE